MQGNYTAVHASIWSLSKRHSSAPLSNSTITTTINNPQATPQRGTGAKQQLLSRRLDGTSRPTGSSTVPRSPSPFSRPLPDVVAALSSVRLASRIKRVVSDDGDLVGHSSCGNCVYFLGGVHAPELVPVWNQCLGTVHGSTIAHALVLVYVGRHLCAPYDLGKWSVHHPPYNFNFELHRLVTEFTSVRFGNSDQTSIPAIDRIHALSYSLHSLELSLHIRPGIDTYFASGLALQLRVRWRHHAGEDLKSIKLSLPTLLPV
ncbi:hypothetical protein BDV93DRAFT_560049 [Ceratobasidium sp. AG-I]|nr:hypothetical protein BDV93DRAFT_560049 [Ceratobasidium sp. AG-I]